jgi:hypothetical protein
MPPQRDDNAIIALLKSRDGQATMVRLTGKRTIRVFNIAWGYDDGDEFAHVTTNISPRVSGEQIDFFFTHEVLNIEAAETGQTILDLSASRPPSGSSA